MTQKPPSTRIQLLRNGTVFQLKLLADGIRDAVLIPVAFAATLIGLIRGGKDPGYELDRVLKFGRRSERWINLFGHHNPAKRRHPGGSMDNLLDRVEEVVTEQYQKGKSTEEARAAINRVINPEPPGDEEPRSGEKSDQP